MRKKIMAWFSVVMGAFLILLGIISTVTQTYYAIVGIPVGIYVVIKFAGDIKSSES